MSDIDNPLPSPIPDSPTGLLGQYDSDVWVLTVGDKTVILVGTASVFTLIAFLLGLRVVLPRVPYLTRMDELVLGATVLVFLALLEVIVTSRMAQQDQLQRAQRIDRYARWMYPLAFVALLAYTLKW